MNRQFLHIDVMDGVHAERFPVTSYEFYDRPFNAPENPEAYIMKNVMRLLPKTLDWFFSAKGIK